MVWTLGCSSMVIMSSWHGAQPLVDKRPGPSSEIQPLGRNDIKQLKLRTVAHSKTGELYHLERRVLKMLRYFSISLYAFNPVVSWPPWLALWTFMVLLKDTKTMRIRHCPVELQFQRLRRASAGFQGSL